MDLSKRRRELIANEIGTAIPPMWKYYLFGVLHDFQSTASQKLKRWKKSLYIKHESESQKQTDVVSVSLGSTTLKMDNSAWAQEHL